MVELDDGEGCHFQRIVTVVVRGLDASLSVLCSALSHRSLSSQDCTRTLGGVIKPMRSPQQSISSMLGLSQM